MLQLEKSKKVNGIFIDGIWGKSESEFLNFDPSSGEMICTLNSATEYHADLAINAAKRAQNNWLDLGLVERIKIFREFSLILQKNVEELAEIINQEQGKSLTEAKEEIVKCFQYIDFNCDEVYKIKDKLTENLIANENEISVCLEPIGVVAAITPWNLPVGMIMRKIIPALVVGCSIVLKPSSETPLSAIKLIEYMSKVFPPGVINLIVSNDDETIGKYISNHKLVNLITFTGSSKVGKQIIKDSSDSMKRLVLELGGSAPCLILNDCDIDQTINEVIENKFRNSGQTCTSINRLYLEENISKKFLEKLISRVNDLKIKTINNEDYDIGPLISKLAVKKQQEHVEDAINKGAELLIGGNKIDREGYFFEPTVIINANNTMKVMTEETFGPVLPIKIFDSRDTIIDEINDNDYGLCAYVYTKDKIFAKKISSKLEYGMIGINNNRPTKVTTPFGGFKQSGYGKENGVEGIMEFVNVKSIYMME